ncbi:RNA polymerase II mediator complex subunit [Orbilia ellipsospora]|uniref:Mediator of RNA polymerase II transcription subunit 17 n=1 Tax=Orbilia ellipsospora TaxID=2528407 RepID=A0AAV9XNU5_9PEZI
MAASSPTPSSPPPPPPPLLPPPVPQSQSLLLALASWPDPDPRTSSLSSLIPRIQSERGPFKNVTEESLLEEIAAAERQQHDDLLDASKDDDQVPPPPEDPPNPREALGIKRQELMKLVEQAQFEAMYALDFVSLLLSGVRPAHAEASLSRHLKENVPSGTLGSEPTRKKDLSSSAKADSEAITKGWRSEALIQSAGSLQAASSRLVQESEREETFWEDVLDVKKEGWAICRIPREPQYLGVRFGFSEAGADEKYRGLGVLRKGTDGAITMHDLGNSNANRNAVRVRILRDDRVVGTSKPFTDDSQTSGITGMIQTARNYAYQHELFLELAREARTLANLGFRNTDEAITFELGSKSSVVIDMMNTADLSSETSESTLDDLAQGLSMALHLLLSHAHRQNLKRRQLPPPILTNRTPLTPPLFLLRPIASHLRHQSDTDEFIASTQKLITYAQAADLKSRITLARCHNCFSKDFEKVESAVDSLGGFLETKSTIVFPGSWKIIVLVQTVLGPSIFGTRFVVQTSHDGGCATLMGNNMFNSQAEVQRYLQWSLERSVINHIQLKGDRWTQIAMSNEMTQAGEQSQYKRLRVEVDERCLYIRWTVGGGQDEYYQWTGDNGKKPLDSLVKSI